MARSSKSNPSDFSYHWTARIRGLANDERYAVIQKDGENTRVVQRRRDGTAPRPGILVRTADVFDIKPTEIVAIGLRGTIAPPSEFRRSLGIEV